jgi:hypothetical protein
VIGAGIATLGLLAAPLALQPVSKLGFDFVSMAKAAEHGGAKGHEGGAKGGQGGAKAGAKGKGGQSIVKATQISGSKLGRLNMARAFVSPGFDITKVDDPLAPIAQVALYKDIASTATSDEQAELAGIALGNAATVNPVTAETVNKVNTILGIVNESLNVDLVAAVATETLLARRTEETEDH